MFGRIAKYVCTSDRKKRKNALHDNHQSQERTERIWFLCHVDSSTQVFLLSIT